jgi:hypothetical protein
MKVEVARTNMGNVKPSKTLGEKIVQLIPPHGGRLTPALDYNMKKTGIGIHSGPHELEGNF